MGFAPFLGGADTSPGSSQAHFSWARRMPRELRGCRPVVVGNDGWFVRARPSATLTSAKAPYLAGALG